MPTPALQLMKGLNPPPQLQERGKSSPYRQFQNGSKPRPSCHTLRGSHVQIFSTAPVEREPSGARGPCFPSRSRWGPCLHLSSSSGKGPRAHLISRSRTGTRLHLPSSISKAPNPHLPASSWRAKSIPLLDLKMS